MKSGRLQQVERELGRIFASLGHGMYVVDEERRILLWNKAAESILGWTEDEVLGRSCRDFIGHLDDEGSQLCDEECLLNASMGKSRTVFAGTVWGHSRSGEKVPVNVSCAPLIDDDGRLVGAVEVFSDMTREKEVERLKNKIVSVVAHELKTPLTSMKGYLELVTGGEVGDINEDQRGFLEIVESNVEKLEALVNDLLDLGRLESGRTTIHWEELDLESMVRECIDTHTPLARDRSLSLAFEAGETPAVQGDRQLFSRIISNLVSNAIKYTKEGGVTVRLGSDGERAILEVADTGVGIPEEEVGRVLERFFRASTALETSSSGSGLGLAITGEIVDKHGGELRVESVLGKGSKFTVLLPPASEATMLERAQGGADG